MAFAALPILLMASPSVWSETIDIKFNRETNQLGFELSDAPFVSLAERLTETTGITIQLDASVADDRLSFSRTPTGTDQALRDLLRQYSHVMYFTQDTLGRSVVRSVQVMAREGKAASMGTPIEFHRNTYSDASGMDERAMLSGGNNSEVAPASHFSRPPSLPARGNAEFVHVPAAGEADPTTLGSQNPAPPVPQAIPAVRVSADIQ